MKRDQVQLINLVFQNLYRRALGAWVSRAAICVPTAPDCYLMLSGCGWGSTLSSCLIEPENMQGGIDDVLAYLMRCFRPLEPMVFRQGRVFEYAEGAD